MDHYPAPSQDEAVFRTEVRDFAEREIAPKIRALDAEERFSVILAGATRPRNAP